MTWKKKRPDRFTLGSAFFVTRTKKNVLLQRRYSHPVDKSTGVSSDQTVILTSFESASAYPYPLRRISYSDPKTGKRLRFFTNNFTLPALTIAEIYKQRWQVELFFKWIKQHLRIKALFGTSENAVKTQIWISISVYVLVAIVRKRLRLEAMRNGDVHQSTQPHVEQHRRRMSEGHRLSPRPLIDLARFDEWPKRRGHKKVVDSDAAVVLKGLSEIVPKGELVGLCMQRPKGIGIGAPSFADRR